MQYIVLIEILKHACSLEFLVMSYHAQLWVLLLFLTLTKALANCDLKLYKSYL
jgi:hypothetical protein